MNVGWLISSLLCLGGLLASGCPSPTSVDGDDTSGDDDDTAPNDDDSSQGSDDDDSGGARDEDEDGFPAGIDCDDSDPEIFPGAPERCNGFDDDCDGALPPAEADVDQDGHPACDDCDDEDPGSPFGSPEDIDQDRWTHCDDCDDEDPDTHPGASGELCAGGDRDCDGIESATVVTGAQPSGSNVITSADAWTVFVDDDPNPLSADLGRGVRFAGDLTGDGQADIVVSGGSGAPAYVFAGPFCNGVVRVSDAVAVLDLPAEANLSDNRLAALGDLDGDGFDDFRGGRCVFFGPMTSDRSCSTPDLWLSGGSGVSTATGDYNGDGVKDLAVGDWLGGLQTVGAGLVHIHYGPFAAPEVLTPLNADSVLEGASTATLAAAAVATIAAPGASDGLAVLTLNDGSAPGGQSTGAVDFWMPPFPAYAPLDTGYGRVTHLEPEGPAAGAYATAEVASLGDLNGDGGSDLFLGASAGGGSTLPVSWYFPQPVAGTHPAGAVGWPITLQIPGFSLGFKWPRFGGDTDGDGVGEWIAGNGATLGATGVHNGAAVGPVDSGDFPWSIDYVALSLDGGTDVDGDGRDDVLLGRGQTDNWAWLLLAARGSTPLSGRDDAMESGPGGFRTLGGRLTRGGADALEA